MFNTDAGVYTINANNYILGDGTRQVDITFTDSQGSFSRTGDAGTKAAMQVFKNVSDAMTAYAMKGSDISLVTFSAATETRIKVYDRLCRTIAMVRPDFEAYGTDSTEHRQYYIAPRFEAQATVEERVQKWKILFTLRNLWQKAVKN